jgi:hypothetical protein
MLREAQIPILLWLPAAVLFHLAGGSGAAEVARTLSGREDIRRYAEDVRAEVRAALTRDRKPTEIELLDERRPEPEPGPVALSSGEDDREADERDRTPPTTASAGPAPAPPPSGAAVPTAPPPPAPPPEDVATKPPEPKPPEPKPPEPKAVASASPAAEPVPPKKTAELELHPDGRIAVINHPGLDPNQLDNPTASRIADSANRTDEETMARHRSYDQNSPDPRGGGAPNPDGPEQPGNGPEEHTGHSVEAPGDGAPKPGSDDGAEAPRPDPVARRAQATALPVVPIGRPAIIGQRGSAGVPPGQGERMPETIAGDDGEWSISPEGGDGRPRAAGQKRRAAVAGRSAIPGVMMPGELPTKYSISALGLMEEMGDQLQVEQQKARNVRLSKHRGVLRSVDFKKYQAAIENYDPAVKLGNQTSLNAARVPFASYINRMHNRIHPIFADGFLASLDGVSPGDKLADMTLKTHLELVLDGATGRLLTAGVVRPSGVTALEVAALRSVEDAGPFGKPPGIILSPDGRVYVHWEFYRDPYYACTSRFARPFLLKHAPKRPPGPALPPTTPRPPSEGERYGKRAPVPP